jgi:ubiquitin-like domain-containing CTD phosphatase 1
MNGAEKRQQIIRVELHSNIMMTNEAVDTIMIETPKESTVGEDDLLKCQMDGTSNMTRVVVTLIAKFGKERITFEHLDLNTTIGQVKNLIQLETRILPKRQKLVGLSAKLGGAKGVHDALPISELAVKGKSDSATSVDEVIHQFILMGTPEEQIFVDPCERDDLPDIVDDFELDFNAGSPEWIQHRANGENLKKFTEHTPVHIMNPPRENKPLLILDLDHTLLDFSSKSLQQDTTTRIPGEGLAASMKRPYMDDFLTKCYPYFDIVVWSQTSWRWLETKLIELGMVSHSGYKFCFVLDKVREFELTKKRAELLLPPCTLSRLPV